MEQSFRTRTGPFLRRIALLLALGTVAPAATPATDSVHRDTARPAPAALAADSTKGAKPLAKDSSRSVKDSSARHAAKDSTNLDRKEIENPYKVLAIIAFGLMVLWIICVVIYLWRSILFYTRNYGLTNEEWKVIHPEIYASEKELEKFQKLRAQILTANTPSADGAGSDGTGTTTPPATPPALTAPEANPYQDESFGLPPGTVRGILALTAMVAFALIEAANLLSPINLESHFKELITVFEMVVAFYFGAKAIDIFNRRTPPAGSEAPQGGADKGQPTPTPAPKSTDGSPNPSTSGTPAQAPQKAAAPEPVPAKTVPAADLPALPPSTAAIRQESLEAHPVEPVAVNASAPSAPPPPTAAAPAPAPAATLGPQTPLATRVLALSAHFETGRGFPDCFAGLSGDFDGQGLSFGALQWCLGQNSLQPLLSRALREGGAEVESALGPDKLHVLGDVLAKPLAQQLEWARSIQFTRKNAAGKRVVVVEAGWKDALVALGRTDTMIRIETDQAAVRYQKALANCQEYGCSTERAVALFFDINVQNGRVDYLGAGARIQSDILNISRDLAPLDREVEILRIVARRRSEVCKAEWRADVLARKLAIAEGQGVVHQERVDLARFAIRLEKYSA